MLKTQIDALKKENQKLRSQAVEQSLALEGANDTVKEVTRKNHELYKVMSKSSQEAQRLRAQMSMGGGGGQMGGAGPYGMGGGGARDMPYGMGAAGGPPRGQRGTAAWARPGGTAERPRWPTSTSTRPPTAPAGTFTPPRPRPG